jgi:hypothetical protein
MLLFSLLVMNGCKSTPQTPPPPEMKDLNIIDWLSLPPPDDELWGIGSAVAEKDYEAMLTATARAKASIRQQLQRYVDSALKRYNEQVDAENRADDSLIEGVAFEINNMLLSESIVNKREQTPNKVWWYRVSYKKPDARTAVFQIFDGEIERYPEFNPNRAIVFFDEQMGKTDPPFVTSK